MKSFIITLISVAFLNGAVGMISPEGDIKKYVRFVGALCILLAIISPLYSVAANGRLELKGMLEFDTESGAEYESIYEDSLISGSNKSVGDTLKSALCQKFKLSPEELDVFVSIEPDGTDYTVASVTVVLHKTTVSTDPRLISDLIYDRTGCQCKILYD